MRIYLVGYMASGKSVLGKILAERLQYGFVDIDYIFEEQYKVSILDFFNKYGEAPFRKMEQEILHKTTQLTDTIIATGGGTPCFFNNMEFINQSGISVYLHWEVKPLLDRLQKIRKKRPLLSQLDPGQLEKFVVEHMQQRSFFYRQAHYTVEGMNPDVEKLAGWIRERVMTG